MYHNNEDRRSIQSKNMLYRALSQKIREKDFRTLTIQEVVLTAQVGRSTFYRNFDDLESILLWKCNETFQSLYRFILESISAQEIRHDADPFPFLLPFFRFWKEDSEIIELLVAARRIDILYSAFENTLKQLVSRLNPALTSRSPHFEYFLAFRSGALIHILIQWIRNRKNLSPEDMYALIKLQSKGFAQPAGTT
ncbi:TetR/AcrR family transcriptional regulator [Cohnella caldifontis]|uniref:TetR/AcrR family transcriptional regulator n=1 Tax=Cohnella caldifontis TaxID=3027471 RepID=UPI0023EB023A|nr:TetR/AcrR family transcriptional regulator [Cohnella sp. YIM B05605]